MSENFTFRTPFKNFLLILAYLVFSAGFAQITTSGPTVSAPDPTEDPADVISMYSGVYSDVPIDTWLTPWSPVGTVLEDIQIQGNDTKKYSNVDFLGIETFANPIDASGMDFFHMDVWTPNATIFRVKLVDFGASITEGEIAFAIPQEQWIRLKIPLADFANPTLVTGPTLNSTSSIAQLILSGLPAGGVTVYIDNVYFSKDATTGPPSYTFDGTGGPLTPTGTTSGVVTYTTEVSGISGSTIAGVTCPSTGVEISDVQVPAILGYNTEITNISLFDVQHTFGADLDLRLVSPSGTIYTFNLDNGGSTGLDVATDMCFDISATDCADTWTSSTSAAQPENCLLFETSENNCGPIDASFSFDTGSNSTLINGDLVNGIWTLEITDDAGGDTGSFASFSITFGTIETPPAIDSLGTPIDLVALCDTGDTCMISNTLLESIECDSNDPNNVLVTVSFDVSNGSGEYELVDMANPGVAIGSLTGPMTGTGLIIEGSVPRPTGPGESVDVKVVDTTVSGSSSGTTELAMNGGFETGDLTGWSEFLSGTQTVTVGGFDPTEGSFAANVNNTDIASAAILKNANLGIGTVNPGDPITVSFDARGSGVDGGVTFAEFFSELSGGGTSSNELLGGAPLALNPDPNVWTSFSFNTVAGPDVSGGVTLQFVAATGGAESSLMDLFIDNVSVSIMGAGALCMGDPITVDLPFTEVSFTALDDLSVDAGVQTGQGGGTPTGGVYSGNGVTDDGNGMTYSFDPAAAGVGVHTITYSYTGEGGCTGSASDDVEVTEPEPEPCMISNTSVDLIECDGENAELTVSFDVTNGSGDYELIDVVGDTVIGTLTGPTSGTGLLILGTVPGPIVAGTAINVKVNDAGLGASGPTNLVMNGDFETGDLTNWGGNSEGGTRNVVDDAGNFVAEVIVNSAAEPWRVGLDQVIPLTQGETYRMTYTASADADRIIIAGIGQANAPFDSSVVSQIINTTPTVYTHDLTPTYDVSNPGLGGRVIFDLGDVESTVRIDNVSVVLLGGDAPEMCMGDAIEVIFPDDCQAGPDNDLCDNASEISCGDSVTGSSVGSTDDDGNESSDVFYSLMGSNAGDDVTVSLCGSGYDTILTILDACNGNEVAINDDSCALQSELSFISDGSTYIIKIEGFNGATGDYALSVTCETPQPAPDNDLFTDAIAVACGDSVLGTTIGATLDEADAPSDTTVEPNTAADVDTPWVWYSFTGTVAGERVTLSTCGTDNTDFDTELFVYTGTSGALTLIDDGFDECGGSSENFAAETSFDSDGSTTYYIAVGGWNSDDVGNFQLSVTCETPDPCAGTTAYEWTGTFDTDWENDGNWMNGSTPGLSLSNSDVMIPLGMPNYPILMVGQDLYIDECSTLMVESDASLIINPNVVVTNDGTVMNDGYAVFESDETGTAYIGAGMGMFIGDFTVERFIPAKRAYRQLSPAVTTIGPISENWQMDTHITGPAGNTDGFDVTLTGNPSMYIFDNDVYNYLEVENTNATNLFPGTMYHILVRGDRNTDLGNNQATPSDTTLKATGELTAENEGSKTIMVDVPEQRFIAVGNPYQSQIDMFNVLEDAVNVAPVFYWVWDPNLGERGAYTAIDVATGTASSGDTDANQNLQSGQAGWVYTAGAGPSSITFDQNKKTNGPETSTFRDGNLVSQGQLRLSLYEDSALANNETATDAVLIMFDSQGNNGIDVYDALNITNLDENFATNNNGTLLSIENRATPVDADVIQLEINTYRNTNYTIVAEGIAMEGPAAYLYDSLTGIYTEIPQSGEVNYSYTVDSENPLTIAGDRFSVVFAGEALSIDDNDIGQIALYPNPTNIGKFYLDVPVGMDDLEVTIYSTLGVRLYHEKGFMGGSTLEIGTEKLFSLGTYFVELSSQGKTITKKLIIN